LAIFYSRMGRYYGVKEGKPLLGVEYSERAFLEAEKIKDVEVVIRAGSDLFPSYSILGQSLKVVDMAQKIIDLLEKTKRELESFGVGMLMYSLAHGYCGWAMAFLGRFEEGESFFEKGLRFAKTNDKLGLGWVEFTYGWHFNIKGQAEDAIEHLRKGVAILEDARAYTVLPIALYQLGWAHTLTKELETARKQLARGLKIQRDVGTFFWESIYYLLLGMVHLDSGDFKRARDCMEEAVRLAQKNNEGQVAGYSKIWLGRILGKSERSKRERAEELILQGVEILEELSIGPWWSQGYLFLAEINADSGNKEKALENLKVAEHLFQEMGMDYWLGKTREVLGRL
jgi:tetratricopeptide (TPR) repeat protein